MPNAQHGITHPVQLIPLNSCIFENNMGVFSNLILTSIIFYRRGSCRVFSIQSKWQKTIKIPVAIIGDGLLLSSTWQLSWKERDIIIHT